MSKKLLYLMSFVLALCLPVSSAGAVEIPIDNPGFEDPVLADDGWDWSMDNEGWGYFDNGGDLGAWNPLNADYVGQAPEGENVGWAEPSSGVPGGFAQVLLAPEAVLKAGTYTLTVEVGAARTYTSGGYQVQLLAGGTPHTPGTGGDYTGPVTGGTLLAEDDNTLSPVKAGTFETSTVIYAYNSALHSHLLGEPLQIRLLALPGGDETEFDDVKLSWEASAAYNPKPPDNAVDVPVETILSWTRGQYCVFDDVYFGTDPCALPLADTIHKDDPAQHDPYDPCDLGDPLLVASTTYYWQVVDRDGNNAPHPGEVWSFSTLSAKTHTPLPVDGEVVPGTLDGVQIYQALNFQPGPTNVRYVGYGSEFYNDVLTRAEDANLGPRPFPPTNTYYMGLDYPGLPYTDSLERGKAYYWCVDGIDAKGNKFAGDVWKFIVQDEEAFDPSPPDEAIFVSPDVLLEWLPGYGPATLNLEHDVYLGTDFDAVKDANWLDIPQPPEFKGAYAETYYQCSGLETETTYYWRIDEVWDRQPFDPRNTGRYIKGHVWSFTTGVSETGLVGEYFHWVDPSVGPDGGDPGPSDPYQSKVLVRLDPDVNFDFDATPPPGVRADDFSVRWTGQIAVPVKDETYTFTTETDDGVRLWVDDVLVIDQWINQGVTPHSGDIPLAGYGPFDIKMEYYERGGGAVARLNWSSPSTLYGIVPSGYLSPSSDEAKSAWSAYAPYPADGGTILPDEELEFKPTLSWGPGKFAATHELYFGDDFDAVSERRVPKIPLTDPCYPYPKLLSMDQIYYWAVDEVNSLGPAPGFWKGDVWSFTPISTGYFVREWWLNISGTAVSALTGDARYPDSPDGSELITAFEGPTDWADNYGSRIHGWLRPPTTGDYKFWIATDDNGELWLSSSEDPADANLISQVTAWAASRNWDDPDVIPSDPIALVAGKKYYISGLLKEDTGGDNISAAWQGPANSPIPARVLIDGQYLSATPYDPPEASKPNPIDNAIVEDRTPLLSWYPGCYVQGTNGHKVYFSDNFADVNERRTAAYKGAQTEPNYPYPETDPPLELGRTYYWAVDEVSSSGPPPGVWFGKVWSFTMAECLFVDNMEDYIDRGDIRGVWTDGYAHVLWGGAEPNWYLSRGGSSGSNLSVSTAVGAPSQSANIPDKGPIHGGRQAMALFYDNDGYTQAPFRPIPGEEHLVWPYDAPYFSEIEANTVENLNIVSDWATEGVKALSLQYQGHPIADGSWEWLTGPAPNYAFRYATLKGRGRNIWGGHDEFYYLGWYPLDNTSGGCEFQTRVIRMDGTNPSAKAGVMMRENMKPYSRYAAVFVTPGNGVTFQWRAVEDGNTASYSEGGLSAPIQLKLERVASGNFIAKYYQGGVWQDVNNPAGQGAQVPIQDMNNLLHVGIVVTSHNADLRCSADFNELAFLPAMPNPDDFLPWGFIGDVGLNDAEQLYVAIKDGSGTVSVVNHPDPNAATATDWQEWNIELTEFANVDFNDVRKVYVGLGDRDTPTEGGSGIVYIDDVRSCPPRCVLSKRSPDFARVDYVEDCVVDYKEVAVMAEDWLVEATDPGTGNLVGWWKLDDATGTTAQDSSIYGNHGTLIGASDWVTGRIGGALQFDGIDDYVDCGDTASLQITGTAISLAAWVKWDTAEEYSTIAMKTSSGEWIDGYGLYADIDSVSVNFYVTNYGFRASKSFAADDQWHHVVGTYDGSNVRVWVDGVEGTPFSYTGSISNAVNSLEIGRGADDAYNFSGVLDDVRVYNMTLTDTDILGLLGLRPDTYEDMKINFKDYALIASKFLDEQLWP